MTIFIAGVMLSHDNFTWDAYNITVVWDHIQMGNEVLVTYLPLSHVAAQIFDVYFAMTVAATVYFADRDAMRGTLVQTLLAARPTQFLAVPRVYEKFQEKLSHIASQSGTVKRMISNWARNVILDNNLTRMAGRSHTSFQYKLAIKLYGSKVKQALGFDRTKTFLTGAAPMNVSTKKFFLGLDIQVIEGKEKL